MSDRSYVPFDGYWNAWTRLQAREAKEEIDRLCAVMECPTPRILWFVEDRAATLRADGTVFGFNCAGWQNPAEVDAIHLRLSVHDDEDQLHELAQMRPRARHEVCHWVQNFQPGRWHDEVRTPHGGYCSEMSQAAERNLLSDEEWRQLAPQNLRSWWGTELLIREARSLDDVGFLAFMDGAYSSMKRDAERLRQQPALARRSAPPAPVTSDAEIGWVEGPTTGRAMRPSRRQREPRSPLGFEISGNVSGAVISIR